MDFSNHRRNTPAPVRDPHLATIKIVVSRTIYPGGTPSIELRFPYDADFVPYIKSKIAHARMDSFPDDLVQGGWNPKRKCWVISENGWTDEFRNELRAYRFANVLLIKGGGF